MNNLESKLPRGRQRLIHGGYSFLTSGRLPEHRVHVRRYLTNCRRGLIADHGGEENLSTAQALLIDRVISKVGCLRCIEEYIRENSVMVGQELAPSLKASYLAFNNSVRLDLLALGIEKKAGKQKTKLEEIIAEYASGKRGGKKEEK